MEGSEFDQTEFFRRIGASGARAVRIRDPETVRKIRAEAERPLTVEEFDAHVNAPMSDEERRRIWELVDWFCRRYPRPIDRLAAARRGARNTEQLSPERDLRR